MIPEGSMFGATLPETPHQALKLMLDKFEDNGQRGHQNPRWIAERLIKNYAKLSMVGGDIDAYKGADPDSIVFHESRRNPLFNVTKKAKRMREALGDTEAYTGDVQSTGAHILPIYIWVLQDMITLMNGVAALQALDRPTGEAFFMKQYYGDLAGTYAEIGANFDRSAGDVAEAGTPKQLKVKMEKDSISLATAKKFQFPYTIEMEQDLIAYWNMGLDSIAVQTCRQEAFREIAADFFYALLNTAALSKGDGLVQNAGSPLEFSMTKDEGWTYGEWLTTGFSRVLKQASSLLDKDPWNVEPDWIIAYSQLKHLFTPNLIADKVKSPRGLGFTREGTYNNEWTLYTSGNSMFEDKIVLGYRGTLFTDAAMIFLPYILFWAGPRIYLTGMKSVRETMSRFAIVKACGAKIITIDIVP
jgi:hypothetical protein